MLFKILTVFICLFCVGFKNNNGKYMILSSSAGEGDTLGRVHGYCPVITVYSLPLKDNSNKKSL